VVINFRSGVTLFWETQNRCGTITNDYSTSSALSADRPYFSVSLRPAIYPEGEKEQFVFKQTNASMMGTSRFHCARSFCHVIIFRNIDHMVHDVLHSLMWVTMRF